MEKGLLLNPRMTSWHRMTVVRVAYFAKDFERAAQEARRGPDNMATRLFEILALAQLGRTDEVGDLARAFKARHLAFDPQEFMRDHPITAAGARRLFINGIEKAGLG